MTNFMKKQFDKLNSIKDCDDYQCKKAIYIIRDKIEDIMQYLNEIDRVENRLRDLDNYLNNNDEILKIMQKETNKNNTFLTDKSNYFSVENYQIDELNNNKNMIEKKMDLYLDQVKKMFFIICGLMFIYFVLISFKPSQ